MVRKTFEIQEVVDLLGGEVLKSRDATVDEDRPLEAEALFIAGADGRIEQVRVEVDYFEK